MGVYPRQLRLELSSQLPAGRPADDPFGLQGVSEPSAVRSPSPCDTVNCKLPSNPGAWNLLESLKGEAWQELSAFCLGSFLGPEHPRLTNIPASWLTEPSSGFSWG